MKKRHITRRHVMGGFLAAALFLFVIHCGCDGGGSEEEQIETSTYSITTTALTAAIVGAPMSGEAEVLYRDRDRASNDEARESAEATVGGEMVAADSCVAFDWNQLEATVTFTDCVSARTGQAISGTVQLSITLRPSTLFVFAFDALTVGDVAFSGSITLEYSGAGEGPTSKLSASLTFESEGSTATVTLDEVVVDVVGDTYTLDGRGHVTTGSVDADFSVAGLVLTKGDCLPSAGTVTFTIDSKTVVVTFSADTPATGTVKVKVGSLPEEDMTLFTPCP
ncbi:MAG: hypothetical protein ABIJ56_04235 [Pseudomonadota bacterium]